MKRTKVKTKRYGLLDCDISYTNKQVFIFRCLCTEYDSDIEIAKNFRSINAIQELEIVLERDIDKYAGKSKIDLTETI